MKMKVIFFSAIGVALAIYTFILLISSVDFKGMSFAEIKLVVSVIVGVSVLFISAKKSKKIVVSALIGFVSGAFLYALIAYI